MKNVLITGGTSSLGMAIVKQFFDESKYKVYFSYHKNKKQADLINKNSNGAIEGFPLNLLDQDSIQKFIEKINQKTDHIDILIHNAGTNSDSPFFLMEEHQWKNILNLSLNSFYYLNKAFLGSMIANRFGRIISLVSVSGEAGNRGQVNYSAAKGAMISATKALAKEVSRKGVLVNGVSPGLIESEMTKDLVIPDLKNLVPIGRMGKPIEVAKGVKFLSSEDASYITGTILQINGGLY